MPDWRTEIGQDELFGWLFVACAFAGACWYVWYLAIDHWGKKDNGDT